MSHPRHDLNETIHTPVRFSLMAALAASDGKVEFSLLRDGLEISDSLLSKHIVVLENAGYVEITKGHVGKRPRTWAELTAEGDRAFADHCATLRKIASMRLP